MFGSFLKEIAEGFMEGFNGDDEQKGDLELKVSEENVTFDDGSEADCYALRVTGLLEVPFNNYGVEVTYEIYDITNGVTQDVYTYIEEYKKKDSEIFCQKDTSKAPYEVNFYEDSIWLNIPKEYLIFPEEGNRRLLFKLTVRGEHSPKILGKAKCKKVSYVEQQGYNDVSTSPDLTLNVYSENITADDGSEMDSFVFNVNGAVVVPSDNYNIKYISEIYDITDGVKKDIHTNDNDGSNILFLEEISEIPYKESVYDNSVWMHIYKEYLIFPKKGYRKLLFRLTIQGEDSNKQLHIVEYTMESYYSKKQGYEDMINNQPILEEMTIRASLYMSNSDGKKNMEEMKVITEFFKLMIQSLYDTPTHKAHKERLRGYMSQASKDMKSNNFNINDTLHTISELANKDDRYVIFQLCLDVAAADGIADKSEIEFAISMAKELKLDKKDYMPMIDKTLPVTMQREDDIAHTFEATLGIEPSMSSKEINKILRQEFKKWNQRVASSDVQKREQAELMVHKISELKKNTSKR